MIELVISIFILVVAIIGVYNSFSTVVVLTAGASSRFTAVYLAQEGIEIIRNMRDDNWLNNSPDWKTGLLGCENGCEADYKTGTSASANAGLTPFSDSYLKIKNNFYSYDSADPFTVTKFKRKITITAPDPLNQDVLRVSVLVTWDEKEETFDIEAEEYLYNWY